MSRGCLGERLVELASDMRPAARQRDLPTAGTSVDERGIRLVPIALERAREVGGDDVRQALGPAAGLPVKEHVAARTRIRPQVTLARAAMTRFQVGDGRLVHLHVAARRARPCGWRRRPAAASRRPGPPSAPGSAGADARRGAGGRSPPAGRAADDRQYLAMSTWASSPAVGRPRSCRHGGRGAMIGVASASPRRTNLRRMSRRRRKRAGS